MVAKLLEHHEEFAFDDSRFERQRTGKGGRCDVRIYQLDDSRILALVSELITETGREINEGISVTNGAEYIAGKIRRELGYIPELIFEHYPARKGAKEEFDLVLPTGFNGYTYTEADWKHSTREEVTSLLGGALPQRLHTRLLTRGGD